MERSPVIESKECEEKTQLNYGCLYMILTSVPGIQQQLLPVSKMSVSHINSFYEEAIKISSYIRKKEFNSVRVEHLRKRFSLQDLSLNDNSFYDQLVFVSLNELENYDIVVIETTGLASHSIGYLIRFCYSFLVINPDKLIVLVQREHQRVRYPAYLLLELNEEKVEDVEGWLIELDSKYLR